MNKMVSATMLGTYLYCTRKLYLEKVFGMIEIPKEQLVFGKIRHNCFETATIEEKNIVKSITKNMNLVDVQNVFTNFYSEILKKQIENNRSSFECLNILSEEVFEKIWPKFLKESILRTKTVFAFAQQNNVFEEELWSMLVPKIKSEISMESEALELRGIIDRLEIYPEALVPVEMKTGSMPAEGVWPSHKVQIAVYMLLAESNYKIPIRKGIVRYLDTETDRIISMNPFLKYEIADLVKKVKEILNSEKIPNFCGNRNKCASCGLKKKCYEL